MRHLASRQAPAVRASDIRDRVRSISLWRVIAELQPVLVHQGRVRTACPLHSDPGHSLEIRKTDGGFGEHAHCAACGDTFYAVSDFIEAKEGLAPISAFWRALELDERSRERTAEVMAS